MREINTRSIIVHEELHKQKRSNIKKRKEKNISMRDAWGKWKVSEKGRRWKLNSNSFLFIFFRCNARRKRGTVHSETETVLCSFWLCSRSSKWLEMEGSEKGRLKRNGGICYPQSGSCHRCHISRSYTNGTIEIDDAVM